MACDERLGWVLAVAGALGCGPQVDVPGADTETEGSSGETGTGTSPSPATSVGGDTTIGGDVDVDDGEDDVIVDDFPWETDVGGGGCKGDCTSKLDLLVVVDNSNAMGEEQAALARSMVRLVGELQAEAARTGLSPDVQVMVTTTDLGNPLCTPFRPDGYDPLGGTPITSNCTGRLQDFTSLDGQTSMPEVCLDVCASDLEPDDPFVAFIGTRDDNVPDVDGVDVDGDGTPDSAAAQTLACMLPQGINGCGFESPLEAMLQALDPMAEWNQRPRPFLREDATLGIVILTDEADCSVANFGALSDPMYQEINPNTGAPETTSAWCWNAGVACDGPDGDGLYTGCHSVQGPLQPLTRYTNYLVDYLVAELDKPVFMVPIIGVPPVTEHDPEAPFQPIEGGASQLVVRDWIDGQYPAGDILPAEWAMGVDAQRKTFTYGIGPACTGQDGMGSFTGQAIPNHRVMEVCQALDIEGAPRCAIESICGPDYDAALGFVRGQLAPRVQGA